MKMWKVHELKDFRGKIVPFYLLDRGNGEVVWRGCKNGFPRGYTDLAPFQKDFLS